MDGNTIATMMSSRTGEYRTPTDLFSALNRVFDLELDVCATFENTMLPRFITPEIDSFRVPWDASRCWMNPPYGRDIEKWIIRAIDQCYQKGNLCVCLLPARTETKWFSRVWSHSNLLLFLRGRLQFGGGDTCAPFPSVISVISQDDWWSSWDTDNQLLPLGTIVHASGIITGGHEWK